jgi:hypothetical protein
MDTNSTDSMIPAEFDPPPSMYDDPDYEGWSNPRDIEYVKTTYRVLNCCYRICMNCTGQFVDEGSHTNRYNPDCYISFC